MTVLSRRQALLTGAASLAGFSSAVAADDSGILRFGRTRDYEITHSLTVTNGNVELSWLELWLPVPFDQPEQSISSAKLTPAATLFQDEQKQVLVARQRLYAELPGEGESYSLSATYRVRARDVKADRTALRNYPHRPYTKDAEYKWYTRTEKKVEANDKTIASLGRELAGTRRAAPDIVRRAYDLVRERTDYKLIDGIGGARYCLDNKHGECSDYSALLVALCRAAGVPARMVTGFWAHKTDGWHCWAEFRLPSGEWIPLDVTLGDENAYNRERYFGGLDNQRVALCKTCDVKLHGVLEGKSEIDFLQAGAWWWWTEKELKGRRHPQVKFSVVGRAV